MVVNQDNALTRRVSAYRPWRLLVWGLCVGFALVFVFQGFPLQIETPWVEAQSASDWPQFQYDVKRTGYNPSLASASSNKVWTRNLNSPIAHRIQPVIAHNVLVVGVVSGTVYALNTTNGSVRWSYSTGGPISYSAAISPSTTVTNSVAYVGSQDGYLYAQNLSTGAELWRAKSGRKPIGGAPLVYGSRVYVGGKDGYFRAFDTANGNLVWSFDTGSAANTPRAPILSTPALSPAKNRIFFAAENLRAYALDLNGNLQWSYQMYGESAAEAWPVVSEYYNVVMFRTKSVYSFHASLGLDDAELFCPGNQNTACGSCSNYNPEDGAYNAPVAANNVTSASAPTQWNEQHAATNSIDWILNTYPQRRTFFAFNLDTGAHVPAPILWTGGGGRVGIPLVVNDLTGNVYVFARTKYSRRDATYFCRKWVDIVRLTFNSQTTPTQGTFSFLACPSGTLCPDAWGFHFIGDETTSISLGGNILVGTGWYHTGSVRVDNGAYYDISYANTSPEGVNGSGGDYAAPASIAGGRVFVKQRPGGTGQFTMIVAYGP